MVRKPVDWAAWSKCRHIVYQGKVCISEYPVLQNGFKNPYFKSGNRDDFAIRRYLLSDHCVSYLRIILRFLSLLVQCWQVRMWCIHLKLLGAEILESNPFRCIQKMNLEMILADNGERENLILKEEVYGRTKKRKKKTREKKRSVGSSIEPAVLNRTKTQSPCL